jgi:hypothetical protein
MHFACLIIRSTTHQRAAPFVLAGIGVRTRQLHRTVKPAIYMAGSQKLTSFFLIACFTSGGRTQPSQRFTPE